MPTATSTVTNGTAAAKAKSNGVASTVNGTSNGTSAHDTSESETTWFQRTCADLSERKLADSGDPNSIMKAVVAKSSILWDNRKTLTYCYLNGVNQGNDIQRNKVDTTIKEWEYYANIIFHKTDSQDALIRISFDTDKAAGSWSYVGQEALSQPAGSATMNLGWIDNKSASLSDTDKGTILHEFGHVLGLMHEHQSPARSGSLTLDEDAVYKYYMKTQNWSAALVKEEIIDVYNKSDVSNYSQLDTTSIMMYFMPAEMNLERVEVPPRHALSDLDKAYMCINYPRHTPHPSAPTWTLDYALDVAGVSGDAKKKILDDFESDKSETGSGVRQLFTVWNAAYMSKSGSSSSNTTNGTGTGTGASHTIDIGAGSEETNASWCSAQSSNVMTYFPDIGSTTRLSFVGKTDLLWMPGQTVTFYFQQRSEALGWAMDLVRGVLSQLENIVNIKFIEASEDSDARGLQFYFEDSTPTTDASSWAVVGTAGNAYKNQASSNGGYDLTNIYLSLPGVNSESISRNSVAQRCILHELGHALGLVHESDPAASATATSFDARSIMRYPGEPLGSNSDSANNKLSDDDKAILKALYPYPNASSGISTALQTLGFTDDQIRDAVTLYQASFDASGACDLAGIAKYRAKLAQILGSRPSQTDGSPSHDAGAPGAPAGVALPTTDGSFLDAITGSLKKFFNPGGGQIFTLQFPGRFLQISEYAWDTTAAGIYGQFIKPTVVNESEFRLVDQLYDVSGVVSGPNGVSLSQVYEQLLNNLIPVISNTGLAKQQDQIRQWLLREVKASSWVQKIVEAQHDTDDKAASTAVVAPPAASSATGSKPQFAISNKLSDDNTINRMELSNALMQEYLQAKQAWEVERDQLIQQALQLQLGSAESATALNDASRRLAHTTAIREAQLASKYADAVVRGYTHNVREYVGFLDVKSPAETLQDAKDSLREAAMSSMDGSLRVYPVQMTPIDWFEGLSTSFTLEDLTSDPTLIEQQIDSKSQQLDLLNSQLVALQYGTKGDVDKLTAQVNDAQQRLDDATSNLANTYSSNVIAMARTCIDAYGKVNEEQLKGVNGKLKMADAALGQLQQDMQKTADAQKALTSASRALSQALAAQALAQATDTRQQQEQIRLQINSITGDLNELTARYQSLNNKGSRPAAQTTEQSVDAYDVLTPVNETSGGSRWQEITMHHMVESDYSEQHDQAQASASSWSCNLWIFSTSGSKSESTASASSLALHSKNEVWVGFRATMVTVDRAGWFQPQFFKQSGSYYHINPETSWSKWPADVKTTEQLKIQGEQAYQDINKYLLPAYPIGFIIAKDITIKVKFDQSADATAKENMAKSAAASGGILCFSYSSSSSESKSDNYHNYIACSDGCVIRIPGPQILGYVMQLTENDTTKDMPPQLPDDFFIPDADYDAATGDTGKAHDISQPTGPGTNTAAPPTSDSTKAGKANCDPSCQCSSGSSRTTKPDFGVPA